MALDQRSLPGLAPDLDPHPAPQRFAVAAPALFSTWR
jgi:hypothetical protein